MLYLLIGNLTITLFDSWTTEDGVGPKAGDR